MTILAIDPVVGPLKRISCHGVVELVPVEADHFKITAVVIIMTGGTFFSFYLGGNMIAPVGTDPGCNLLVAIQTFFIGDLFTQNMAFHAVGHPFEVRMCLCQISRAQLCKKRPCRYDQ